MMWKTMTFLFHVFLSWVNFRWTMLISGVYIPWNTAWLVGIIILAIKKTLWLEDISTFLIPYKLYNPNNTLVVYNPLVTFV